MPEIQRELKHFTGWSHTGLPGEKVRVFMDNDAEAICIELGRRLTPEAVGESRRIEPLPRGLSQNRRMIMTTIVMSPEKAIALHEVLSKALAGAGLIEKTPRS